MQTQHRSLVTMSQCRQQRAALAAVGGLLSVTLGLAYVIQSLGFAPCELCYNERIPYFIGIPLASALSIISHNRHPKVLGGGLIFLGILFIGSAALGLYHSGVELKWWSGPSTCTGIRAIAPSAAGLIDAIEASSVVPCDVPALKVLGLSLSAWNAIVSLSVACVAFGVAPGPKSQRAVQ